MADDSMNIITPLECHPCDTPRGCTYYNTTVISDCQQLRLNELKLATIKSDEKYLHRHPEVRAFVALITRHVFRRQPRRNIPLLIKEFFDRPRNVIEEELAAYLSTRPPVEPESEGGEEEEEAYYREDVKKYLASLKPTIEEQPYPHPRSPPADEVNTEEFIKQLLLDRVRQFPSFHVGHEEQEQDAEYNETEARDSFEFEDDTFHQIRRVDSNLSDQQKTSPMSILRVGTKSLIDIISMSGDEEEDVLTLSRRLSRSRQKSSSSSNRVRLSVGIASSQKTQSEEQAELTPDTPETNAETPN